MSNYITRVRKASRRARYAVRDFRHSHQFLPKHSSAGATDKSARFSKMDEEEEEVASAESDWMVMGDEGQSPNPLLDDEPLFPADSSGPPSCSNNELSVDSDHLSNATNSHSSDHLPPFVDPLSEDSEPLSISPDPSPPSHTHSPSSTASDATTKSECGHSQQKILEDLFGVTAAEENEDEEEEEKKKKKKKKGQLESTDNDDDDFFDELEKDSTVRDTVHLMAVDSLGEPVVDALDTHELVVDNEEEEEEEEKELVVEKESQEQEVEKESAAEDDSRSDLPNEPLNDNPPSSQSSAQSSPPSSPISLESKKDHSSDLFLQTDFHTNAEDPIPNPLTGPVDLRTESTDVHVDATECPTGKLTVDETERAEASKDEPSVRTSLHATETTVDESNRNNTSHTQTDNTSVLLADVTEHPLGIEDSSPLLSEKRDRALSELTFRDDFFTKSSPSPHQLRRPASFHEECSPSTSPRGSPLLKQNKTGKMVPVVPPRPQYSRTSPNLPRKLVNTNGHIGRSRTNEVSTSVQVTSVTVEEQSSTGDQPSMLLSAEDLPDQGRVTEETEVTRLTNSLQAEAISNDSSAPHSTDDAFLMLYFTIFTFVVYSYYSLNPFVYLSGFICGFFVFFITTGAAFVWYVQHSEREKVRKRNQDRVADLPPLENLPSSIIVDFESHRELFGDKFGMVHKYHPAKHHPSHCLPAKVRLYKDFFLEVRYRCKSEEHLPGGGTSVVSKEEKVSVHLHRQKCSILILPEEVAQNRKRRWSKKFPIVVMWKEGTATKMLYLFTHTSRDKEEWFRRMKHAAEGGTYDELVTKLKVFYRYMGKYMPEVTKTRAQSINQAQSQTSQLHSSQSHAQAKPGQKRHPGKRGSGARHSGGAPSTVKFSMHMEEDDEDDFVKINKMSPEQRRALAASNGETREEKGREALNVAPQRPSPHVPLGWITAGMARVVWDIWHEDRWRNWATSRIQRKLIRIKTPRFLEPLKVTEVCMGMDMPVIKRAHKSPIVDNRGVWVYLEVEYRGSFIMTIETKLKLSRKKEDIHYSSTATTDDDGTHSLHRSRSPSPTPPTQALETLEHQKVGHHTRVPPLLSTRTSLRQFPSEQDEEISSGSDDEGTGSSITSSSSSLDEAIPVELESLESQEVTLNSATSEDSAQMSVGSEMVGGRKARLLSNMVNRFTNMAAKSKLIQKAANRVANKVSSYPLLLTVEVNALDGFLAINMAPPPSDAIWYGFEKNPRLKLHAKPKLGHREVTLSYVTDWIEKKLCEVVEKKLVLPNMEDLVIPLLNSGLPEDKRTELMSP